MAIIDSMTPRERRNPDLLKASRKKRIAAGSGTKVEEINRLLKMHRSMADMMKAMGGAKRGPMAGLAQMMGFGGGMPSPEEMAKLAEKMPGGLPPGMPGAPPGAGLPANMPGLPPNFPGLPGLGRSCPASAAFPDSERRNERLNRTKKGNAMSLKIRLARAGTKKRPFYHIVIADSRAPRDGRFIERLGYFNPLLAKDHKDRLKLDLDKVKAWMAKGAQPTDRVMRFLDEAGIMKRETRNNPEKAKPKKKAQERRPRPRAAAAAAAAQAAADAGRCARRSERELTVAAHLRRADRRRARRARRGAAASRSPRIRSASTRYGPLETEDGATIRDRGGAARQGHAGRAAQGRCRPQRRRGADATSGSMSRASGCRSPTMTSSITPT